MRFGRFLAVILGLALTASLAGAGPADAGDSRWVFYTKDKTAYTSPWFKGAHRIMVPFGCTAAPYYSPDSRCAHHRGFHHGMDIAMRCGTPLYARVRLHVVSHASLGPAYGDNPVLLRNRRLGFDLVIGHTRKVYVDAGDVVRKGRMFARANDRGAPDGCHLHFEQRAVRGSLSTAVWPRDLLRLQPREAVVTDQRVLSHFLSPDGRLHTIPSKHAKRLVVLDHLAQSFEPGQRYEEVEVNLILRGFHSDCAALRRYLVENDFLTREAGVYWRSGGTVDIE